MLEKIGHIKNPLSVIAIFAGLAEISGTVVLPLLTPETQQTYVWFLMVFPILLISLFFFVLYNKYQVLYAPSDYQSDETFSKLFQPAASAPVVTSALEEQVVKQTQDSEECAKASSPNVPVSSTGINEESAKQAGISVKEPYVRDFRGSALYAEDLAIRKFEQDYQTTFTRNAALRNNAKIRFDAISVTEPMVAVEIDFTRASSTIDDKFERFIETVRSFKTSTDENLTKGVRFIYVAITDSDKTLFRLKEKVSQFNSRKEVVQLQIRCVVLHLQNLEKEIAP